MRAALFAVGLAACTSWTFDSGQPDIPIIDSAPATTSLPRLNRNPASGLGLVSGAGGSLWATFQETIDGVKSIRNVNLDGPGEEVLNADHVDRFYYGFYIVNRPKDAMPPVTQLSIHTPGVATDDQFTLPGGPGLLLVGGSDNIFLYWPQAMDTQSYSIYRRDKHDLPLRSLQVPPGTDPTDPQATLDFRFAYGGARLFIRDSKGNLSWHSTQSNIDQQLGVRPPLWFVDEGDKNVLTCGNDGLRQVPLDNSGDTVLDTDPCAPSAGYWLLGGQVIYGVGEELRKVSLVGKFGPMKVLDPGLRIIGTLGDGRIFYSTDAANKYVNGVGNGFLADWQFMSRGGRMSLSPDGKQLNWIDNAAQMSGVGDLYSAAMPVAPATVGGSARPLARNVSEYANLYDGRMLIEENHQDIGIDNRVVVLDAHKKYKRWVAQQARAFSCIDYACSDLLVDVVSGATGFDIVRTSVPPPLCNRLFDGQPQPDGGGHDHPSGPCSPGQRCDHIAGEGTWDCTCQVPDGMTRGTWSCAQP